MQPEQFFSLLQTMVRANLTTASIGVAIFLYLLSQRRTDCERFAEIKLNNTQGTAANIPHGFEDISFTAWKLRMDVFIWSLFIILVLMFAPPLIALLIMWSDNSYAPVLYHIILVATELAVVILLCTLGRLWWIRKDRDLHPVIRGMF